MKINQQGQMMEHYREAAKERCMLLGESQCKAVYCFRFFVYGPRERCSIGNTTTLIDHEEDPSYAGWTTYIPESECFLIPQYYEEPTVVAARYSVCGEPQCSNATKAWANRECSIVIQECGGFPEDVLACVEDICSLDQAGYADAINITDAYCDPFGERNDTDPTPDPDSSTTTTTPGVAWCSEESGTGIRSINSAQVGFVECAMPPTYEQCNAYGWRTEGEGARRGEPYDKTDIPTGCFKFYQFNVGWVGFNSLPGPSTSWSNKYSRLCCGTEVVPTTTTTTTPKPFVFLPPPTGACCTKPPLQPNNKSDPLDDLEFRDQIARRCRIHNDPHIDTFDGARVSFFSVGNYWLVNSRDLWIQSRFQAIGSSTPGRSFGTKLAIGGPLLEGNTMMFEESLQYWWNDQLMMPNTTVATYMNGKVTVVAYRSNAISVQLPFGISLKIINRQGWMTTTAWLQVLINMRPLKDMDGFCGNGDAIRESAGEVISKWGQKIPAGSSQALIPY